MVSLVLTYSSKSLLLLLSRFSCVQLYATLWTAAHQAPPSTGFSRQEYWSALPFPSQKLWKEVIPSHSIAYEVGQRGACWCSIFFFLIEPEDSFTVTDQSTIWNWLSSDPFILKFLLITVCSKCYAILSATSNLHENKRSGMTSHPCFDETVLGTSVPMHISHQCTIQTCSELLFDSWKNIIYVIQRGLWAAQ